MTARRLNNDFVASLDGFLPAGEAHELVAALSDTEPTVSVRLNTGKGGAPASGVARVPWCPPGMYLDERAAFTFDPHFHAGRYYVQDASSMFFYHVIKQLVKAPVAYLDLCAAPGGKTTTAIDALPAGSLVVANEVVPQRALALRDNVARWGYPGTVVTRAMPAAIGTLGPLFDVVAADVPCSGEGMMRKDEEAARQWSPALVAQCAERQRGIVADIWPALKPGGLLIYSTCTFNRHENEEILDLLIDTLGAEPVAVETPHEWGIAGGIDTPHPCHHFFPHRTRGEGLFVAVVRKPAGAVAPQRASKGGGKTPPFPQAMEWLSNPEQFAMRLKDDTIYAIPRGWEPLILLIEKKIPVLAMGVETATVKGRKIMPAHGLALSTALRADAFPTRGVDYATALAFLRGESFVVEAPRGPVLLAYEGSPLGFVNNLGNRANNLYPKPLRILNAHNPSTPPQVIIPNH